jgi:hypothetical protein
VPSPSRRTWSSPSSGSTSSRTMPPCEGLLVLGRPLRVEGASAVDRATRRVHQVLERVLRKDFATRRRHSRLHPTGR